MHINDQIELWVCTVILSNLFAIYSEHISETITVQFFGNLLQLQPAILPERDHLQLILKIQGGELGCRVLLDPLTDVNMLVAQQVIQQL